MEISLGGGLDVGLHSSLCHGIGLCVCGSGSGLGTG